MRSLDCVYEGERVKRRKLSDSEKSCSLVTSRPQAVSLPRQIEANRNFDRRFIDASSAEGQHEYSISQVEPSGSYLSPRSTINYAPLEGALTNDSHDASEQSEDLLDQLLSQSSHALSEVRDFSVWIRTANGDEYTGPSSGISTLSDAGLSWIERRTKGCYSCLCKIFKQLRSTLLNHLRQPKCIGPTLWSSLEVHSPQKALPPWDVIQEYVETYFSEVQVHFPVLNRKRFEANLMEFKSKQYQGNPSWKALLFAVLASGCRAALSDETAFAFQNSTNEAWAYFISALSFEPALVHVATDLTAVQTLAVMTVFAQGMSSPQRLEYTLCSTAVRLAFSLALHRIPPAEWNLTDQEKDERNRTFWVVYCLDKTLSLRCGRPSGIDDAEISCEFPRSTVLYPDTPSSGPGDTPSTFDFFLCITRYARICSRISRRLYSASALKSSCSRLAPQASQLLIDLQNWRGTIPGAKTIWPSKPNRAGSRDMSKAQLVFLRLSYYYALCTVYRRFSPIFCHEDEDEIQVQSLISGVISTSQIEAARSMVLLTKYIDVESYSPGWLVFYQPMTALITIFLHFICNPTDASAAHDIALMEVAVGFFGRLEYITSGEAGFIQVTEFVRQARYIANKSEGNPCKCSSEELADLTVTLQGTNETLPRVDGSHGENSDVSHEQNSNHLTDVDTITIEQIFAVQASHSASTGTHFAMVELPNGMQHNNTTDDGVNHVDMDLPYLGGTSYDPWLGDWLSPTDRGLSGGIGVA